MAIRFIFRCQFCDATPDPLTQLSLVTAMRESTWGAYQDALPGRWLIFHARGLYGPARYACPEHRGDLVAYLREHYQAESDFTSGSDRHTNPAWRTPTPITHGTRRRDAKAAGAHEPVMTNPSNVIETERLTKRYGSSRGIEDISLTVLPGEVFGFLGPNGAGKTTTIQTLLDLLHPTSGSARLFGLDSHRDSLAIRARIGNLPGDFACDPRRTGREIVEHFAALRGTRGLGRAAALAERFSADLDRPVGHLSRGNRQKIGLIQALFHEPELLILDEPTGELDPLMQEQFHELDGVRSTLAESRSCCPLMTSTRSSGCAIASRSSATGGFIGVERIANLARRRYRHVKVEFTEPVVALDLLALPGLRELETDGTVARFGVAPDDLDGVIKELARHTIVDLELAHPSLEEIFLTYYADEQQAA